MKKTPADLAVLLLDDPHAQRSRRANAHFEHDLDFIEASILQSIPEVKSTPSTASLVNEKNSAEKTIAPSASQSFSLASRLGRDHFDDQLRAEALVSAIKKLRQRPLPPTNGSGRVIKSS